MSTKTEPLKEHRKRRRLHREGGEEGSGEGRTGRGGGLERERSLSVGVRAHAFT